MSIQKRLFDGALSDGRTVECYTLTNAAGMTLEVIPYGCRVTRLLVPDQKGKLGDVMLGHKTLAEYENDYQGAFVGRYANRIGGAHFTIGGTDYQLARNDGENSLHGGPTGFSHQLFDVEKTEDSDTPSITFAYVSADGHEGFPGRLTVRVTYGLTAENEWKLHYEAETDKETLFNPTHHAFFNLSGDHRQNVLDTELQINASRTTPVSEDLIPTGEIVSVLDTALDFTKPKLLGQDMFSAEETVAMCGGFDHNFCVDGTGMRKFAEARHPASGRVMEVFSDMPGVQLYTSNRAAGTNKDGSPMVNHGALCLETQFYPDSPNQSAFPFRTLKPGEVFTSDTVYRFSVQ